MAARENPLLTWDKRRRLHEQRPPAPPHADSASMETLQQALHALLAAASHKRPLHDGGHAQQRPQRRGHVASPVERSAKQHDLHECHRVARLSETQTAHLPCKPALALAAESKKESEAADTQAQLSARGWGCCCCEEVFSHRLRSFHSVSVSRGTEFGPKNARRSKASPSERPPRLCLSRSASREQSS